MIIRTETEFVELLEKIDKVPKFSVDTEGTTGTYPNYKMCGVSISLDGKTGFYIPTEHLNASVQLSPQYVTEKLKPFFEQPGKILYMHNFGHDAKVFRLVDPTLQFHEENAFCTMTSSFILDVTNENNLKACAFREFKHKMLTLDEIGCPKTKNKNTGDFLYFPEQLDIKTLSPYAIDDAIQTFRLGDRYSNEIIKLGYSKMFFELEMPLMFILMEMEENGILLDKERLTEYMEDAPRKLSLLEKEIQSELPVNYEVNLNSGPQMNEVLFNVMGVKPYGKRLEKSGMYSVTNDFLDLWASKHPVCGKISDYRKLNKLLGNYLSNLYHRLSPDGRIRCHFNRHVAATGRLSSSKPNLQNIPRPENDTYGLRCLFKAEEGHDLVVADYSQVELRVTAHLSQDPSFIEAFKRGDDIHSITAKDVFKLKCDAKEVKKLYPIQRQISKSVNFGIIYEAGPRTLTATANKEIKEEKDRITEEEMKVVSSDYFRKYPRIKQHIENCHQQAIKHGFVKTIVGRKRPLPDARLKGKTKDENKRMYGAYRQASNTPTQGSAADIIAIAKRNIKRRLINENLYRGFSKFVLQVHDEIVLETKEAVTQQVAVIVKEEMETAVVLRVPLIADVNVGKVWGEVK